jgi:HAMP domain-containing protein
MLLSNTEQQIAAGRLDLEPAAGITRREIAWLEGLLP